MSWMQMEMRERLTGECPEWSLGIEPDQVRPGNCFWVQIALAIAAAVASAYAAHQQGQATQASLDYQAETNLQQARREQLDAAQREEDFRRDQSALMAKRRAMMGVSGVESGTGSPLLVSEDFAGEVELNALRIRSGGQLAATRLQQQAQLNRFQGSAAARQGNFRAGSALLSGAAKAYGAR